MYVKELPPCSSRFGRTEHGTIRFFLACGFNEVDPEDCIMCGGFTKSKLEFRVHTYIRQIKRKEINDKYGKVWNSIDEF